MDPDDPLSIMWWNPTRGDFISSEFGVLDGLGKLRSARYARFQTMKREMVDRVDNTAERILSPIIGSLLSKRRWFMHVPVLAI
jgi:hypothetical protein